MKRGYYVHNNDCDQSGLAIVAASAREAKGIAWKSGEFVYGDTGWLDITVRWIRRADVDDLPIGIVQDDRRAMIVGLYDGLADYPCDVCGKERDLVNHCGRAMCGLCISRAGANE